MVKHILIGLVSLSAVSLVAAACGGNDPKSVCLKMADKVVECAPEIAKVQLKAMGQDADNIPDEMKEKIKTQAAAQADMIRKKCDDPELAKKDEKDIGEKVKKAQECLGKSCAEFLGCIQAQGGM